MKLQLSILKISSLYANRFTIFTHLFHVEKFKMSTISQVIFDQNVDSCTGFAVKNGGETISIVDHFQNNRFNLLHGKRRGILIVLAICAFIINGAHDFLMFKSVQFIPDVSPLVVGANQTIYIFLVGDACLGFGFCLAFWYKIDFTEFSLKWSQSHLITPKFSPLKTLARLNKSLNLLLIFIMFASISAVANIIYLIITQTNRDEHGFNVTLAVIHMASHFLMPLLFTHQLYLLFASTVTVKSLFTQIGKQIKSHTKSTWSAAKLSHYRQQYALAIELANEANNIWSQYLAFFYPSINLMAIIFVYYIISGPINIYRYFIFAQIAGSIFLLIFYLNHYIIGINTEASSIYDIVYEKTFYSKNVNYLSEINLFLDRIGRENVGYRFEGFVYSPGLVASTLTLIVTIIIAFPSFV
uniref:Gustatory receptor n=1 Tax=Tetranychus urticae TaxID=32264 RepID=T1KKR8_TETUR